ncbi:hypothetical protein [Pedobacter sp. UBA5917]|jgi:hypothetical protein|uniref:hypothetical protein n=1 Tax=Pedobacter sp. UBA5917 TaxID=1947061 RepID=UPI0025CE5F9E|nr:hypothetical protein [Pedobacter sp. UBA5917]
MKKIKLILSLFAIVFLPFFAIAQDEIFMASGVGGNIPLKSVHYTEMNGSPFLNELWMGGVVKLANGKFYKDVNLKYDQILDEVYFLGEKDQAMLFNIPVLEFKIQMVNVNGSFEECYFVNGYSPIDGATEKSYYQKLMYTGNPKTQLVKRTVKKIYESRVYNSAVTSKTVEATVFYYLSDEKKKLRKVKLDAKSIIAGLGDKQTDLVKYIEANKLNLKKEEDAIKLVSYYNSI